MSQLRTLVLSIFFSLQVSTMGTRSEHLFLLFYLFHVKVNTKNQTILALHLPSGEFERDLQKVYVVKVKPSFGGDTRAEVSWF